ncbi:family 1 encapsulin nanocompartment shell protein [Microbacterium sp. 10M-3C3]|jgi:uncharacterized linocin/CFP29 family protein|uniref:family 1 encapsulin nanocompartment shell protein n=1 Tax=Microbacterium sp. 10M-3C3 TaxID=2483401 RepID=UPI000F635CC7|nr:family 1 encapsulin nanocompartment shell protein [Microbacterium sp. 10M-3C3]
MNHLLRHLAPITERTWATLDHEARTRLAPALGARALVDFAGPLGWEHSGTSLGRVGPTFDADGVRGRSRRVLPLVEARAAFSLSRDELDADARGAADTDLGPLDDAAARLARRENTAVLDGWEAAGITGVTAASPHAPLALPGDLGALATVVASAVETLAGAGVGGPYGIALDSPTWIAVSGGSDDGGAPLRHHLERVLGGPVVWAPGLRGAVVVSRRGGDFLFESGQDISLGYAAHTADAVELYLEESFSFRVATPEAAIALR